MTMPATKTARKPDPCSSVVAPYSSSTLPEFAADTRRLARQGDPAHEPEQGHAAGNTSNHTDCHLEQEVCGNSSEGDSTDSAWRASSPAIKAMPTGLIRPGFRLSRIVPLRPEISCWPRTENTTAGSVGDTAVADQQRRRTRPSRRRRASGAAGGRGRGRCPVRRRR